MKTYLITGCCGFIGSNLALRLLKEGNKVIGVDRRQTRHFKVIEELTDRKSTRLNSSHVRTSRMPSSA